MSAFSNASATKSEQIVCVIGEKQDGFKQEIKMLNALISSSQDKLSALTTDYMEQQRDNTQNEEKINKINQRIKQLMETKNVSLPNALSQIESDNNSKNSELHQKKVRLKQ